MLFSKKKALPLHPFLRSRWPRLPALRRLVSVFAPFSRRATRQKSSGLVQAALKKGLRIQELPCGANLTEISFTRQAPWMRMMMHTPSSAVVIYHTGYERKTWACARNVQRIRQSDINADLLPSYLNVIKPLSSLLSHPVSLSTLLSLSRSLFLSHTTNTAHNLLLAVQKLLHEPQARLCHLHSGL